MITIIIAWIDRKANTTAEYVYFGTVILDFTGIVATAMVAYKVLH